MKKRIVALCLLLTLCMSLCACGQRISQEEAIAIALEDVESQTGLDLTVDMADCEKIPGSYRVTFLSSELRTPVSITVDAETGEIAAYESLK